MAIRWVSDPESIKANQPSVLAIAETLAAMGVSVWIAVTWDTYLHIAIGASIAPLLLMRTDESCVRGAAIATMLWESPIISLDDLADKVPGFRSAIRMTAGVPLLLLWMPILLLLARIAASVATLVRHPLVVLAVIPGNWRYATVVLDSKKLPHILPEPRNEPGLIGASQFFDDVGELISEFRGKPDEPEEWAMYLALMVAAPFIIVPAFVYRWSLKSTAIIWFPLLWGMRSVRKAGKTFREYLRSYVVSPWSVIVLMVSIAAIFSFLAKIIMWNEWAGFVDWWNATPLRQFLSLYVTPAEIQWWQVAMVINSAIAIVMYFLALQWLVVMKHGRLTSEAWPRRAFQVGLFIRPILSGYTIACTLYITIRAASDWELPPLGTRLFPWM